jgi:hypothetical protein
VHLTLKRSLVDIVAWFLERTTANLLPKRQKQGGEVLVA